MNDIESIINSYYGAMETLKNLPTFTDPDHAWNVRHAIVLREQKRSERDEFFFLFGQQGEYVGRREVVA